MTAQWAGVALAKALLVDSDLQCTDDITPLMSTYFPVEVARDAASALNMLAVERVVAVVVDLTLPDMSGLELVDRMRRMGHEMPILAVSDIGLLSLGNMLHMLDAQYVLKGHGWLANVCVFAERSFARSFHVSPCLLRTIGSVASAKGLTTRERQALLMACAGTSRSQMAHRLSISRWTLKTHMRNLVSKFDAADIDGVVGHIMMVR